MTAPHTASYLLCDIGGTQTRVAVADSLAEIREYRSFATPKIFAAGMKELVKTGRALCHAPVAVVVGVRGIMMEDRSGIQADGILSDWAGQSIVAALSKEFGVPVLVENDTALAGLGEAHFGAGKGIEIVAYHTISTGVGGVKIVEGQIDVASVGFEPGHQILDIDRTILGIDITPTLENLVSGTALEERFGMKAPEIPQSDTVWDELAEYLAQGLHNTILYWSPDMIILGGAMIMGDPAIPLEAVRKYTVASMNPAVPTPFITKGTLGDAAGLYGGLVLLEQANAVPKA